MPKAADFSPTGKGILVFRVYQGLPRCGVFAKIILACGSGILAKNLANPEHKPLQSLWTEIYILHTHK